ncbi:uncharacterized protein PAC_19251 [Phialocephala subalpina]|uniref:N-acetyltransferase domain-containing protein n=1 Tax=Phialocephala subalpina TaxID=576137 RepID=A0A1L7XWC3_9HELO|nr:uncharacterized protein PAC_19251 [Phialocephala subalpina]
MAASSHFRTEIWTGPGPVDDDWLSEAASFFSQNYGIWSPLATSKIGKTPGSRVKMSPKRLKEAIIPPGGANLYVRMIEEETGKLVGHVFATTWTAFDPDSSDDSDNHLETHLWITQLCVHREYRSQGIAKQLLDTVKYTHWNEGIRGVGILSSHPFALSAVLSVFGQGLDRERVQDDLMYIKEQARKMMESCPVEYVRCAKVRGTLFEEENRSGERCANGDGKTEAGIVSCADTGFWVDHGEPEEALRLLEGKGVKWPFGNLPDGCEFLVIVKSRRAFAR